MDSVHDIVVTGESDDLLAAAVYSAGRGAFVKQCARGFARSLAAKGDLAAAAEILRLQSHRGGGGGGKRGGGWCTAATLALARKVCGDPDLVQVHCEGEDRVLIRAAVVSGDDEAVVSGLASMLAAKETAEALAHARIIGITAPAIVFDAVLAAELPNRTRKYAQLLRGVYHLVGADRGARRSILDAAVAFGTGDVRVSPPSAAEAQERMRMIALYSAPKRSLAPPARRGSSSQASGETLKCLDIEGLAGRGDGGEPCVEVVKCSG